VTERPDLALWGILMSVDLALPTSEKMTIVREAIGDDKIWRNSSRLDDPIVILPEHAPKS
jgi:hypothetical protein